MNKQKRNLTKESNESSSNNDVPPSDEETLP